MSKENSNGKNLIRVKPYTIKDLAGLYNVNRKTMSTWLKLFEEEIGKKRGRYYLIPQVEIIFQKIGLPCVIDPESGNNVQ